jgi:hypothetical protein
MAERQCFTSSMKWPYIARNKAREWLTQKCFGIWIVILLLTWLKYLAERDYGKIHKIFEFWVRNVCHKPHTNADTTTYLVKVTPKTRRPIFSLGDVYTINYILKMNRDHKSKLDNILSENAEKKIWSDWTFLNCIFPREICYLVASPQHERIVTTHLMKKKRTRRSAVDTQNISVLTKRRIVVNMDLNTT